MKEFDIKIRTYNFSKDLLFSLKQISHSTPNDVIIKQVIRSGTSIGANVAESRGGVSKKDFSHYFSIALKSTNETIYWLNLLKDTNPTFESKAGELLGELNEISKILAKIVINCRKD